MAITVAEVKKATHTTGGQISHTFASAPATTDLLLAHCVGRTGSSGTAAFTCNTGSWTSLGRLSSAGAGQLFWRWGDGSTTTFTFDIDGGTDLGWSVVIQRITGADPTTPFPNSATTQSGSGNSITISIPVPNDSSNYLLVGSVWHVLVLTYTDTTPTGTTEDADQSANASNQDISHKVWHDNATVAGGSSNQSRQTSSSNSGTSGSNGIPIREAPSGVTVTPTGVTAASSAINPTVVKGSVTITPTGVTVASSAGAPTVVKGSLTVTPTGASHASSAGLGSVTTGGGPVTPTGVVAASSVGTPTLTRSSVTITPAGVTAASSAGLALVVLGSLAITPQALAALVSSLQIRQVDRGSLTVAPTLISRAATVALGSVSIPPLSNVTVTPAGVVAASSVPGPSAVTESSLVIVPAPVVVVATLDVAEAGSRTFKRQVLSRGGVRTPRAEGGAVSVRARGGEATVRSRSDA